MITKILTVLQEFPLSAAISSSYEGFSMKVCCLLMLIVICRLFWVNEHVNENNVGVLFRFNDHSLLLKPSGTGRVLVSCSSHFLNSNACSRLKSCSNCRLKICSKCATVRLCLEGSSTQEQWKHSSFQGPVNKRSDSIAAEVESEKNPKKDRLEDVLNTRPSSEGKC